MVVLVYEERAMAQARERAERPMAQAEAEGPTGRPAEAAARARRTTVIGRSSRR